jgi:hypothetical protein
MCDVAVLQTLYASLMLDSTDTEGFKELPGGRVPCNAMRVGTVFRPLSPIVLTCPVSGIVFVRFFEEKEGDEWICDYSVLFPVTTGTLIDIMPPE